MAGTANDLTVTGPGAGGTAITYNPSSQLTGITRSNPTNLYAWTGHYNINRAYGTNGLNQLTSAGATALGYDGRGNLTSSGSNAYTYTSENRLATAPSGVTLTYDPTGRLSRLTQGASITKFVHLGPRLIIERDASGTILRRYVHGPGDDEPVVWYEGASLSNKRFLHTDERGSVIAVSNSTGASTATNRYDEYGIPASSVALAPGTSGRFMYTGQMWIPEVGLYYYKARFYSPTLGRFMQTDPIGYKDGINWYAYVDDDPINRKDPTGLATCANKNCTLSKIDVKPNGPNGPTISSKPGVDRTVTTPTAKMVEAAVISSGAKSVNLSDGRSSSAPHQAGTSRHAVGKAVDINEVNGVKVSPTNAGATALQKAFSNQINIRENFGPNSQTKTVNGSVQAMGNNVHQSGPHKGESIRQEHQNHLHVSGQD